MTEGQKAQARHILQQNACGEPVGYRVKWEKIEEDPTLYRSITIHPAKAHVVGYWLIGTQGWVEVSADMTPIVCGTLYPLEQNDNA